MKFNNPGVFVFWATVGCLLLGFFNQIWNNGHQDGINTISVLYLLLIGYGVVLSIKSIENIYSKVVLGYSVIVFMIAGLGVLNLYLSRVESAKEVERIKAIEKEVFREDAEAPKENPYR